MIIVLCVLNKLMICLFVVNGIIGLCFFIESNIFIFDKFFVDVILIGYNGVYNNVFLNGVFECNIKLIVIFDLFENLISIVFLILNL